MKNRMIIIALLILILIINSNIGLAATVYEWQTNKPTDYKIVLKDNGRVYLTVSLDFFVRMLRENHGEMSNGQIRMHALRAAKVDMMNEYIRIRDGERQFKIGPTTFQIKISGMVQGVDPQQRDNVLELFLGIYDENDGIISIDWRKQ